MQRQKYKQWMRMFFMIFSGQLFIACGPQNAPKLEMSSATDSLEQGVPLTQATHVVTSELNSSNVKHVLSPAEEFWVGQYSAVIPCTDPFAECDEGHLTYIVHFSAEGYTYRNMLVAGQINVEGPKRKRHAHRKDQWSLSSDQQYLVAHLKEGVDIFWKIRDDGRIELDIDAIRKYNLPEQYNLFFHARKFPAQALVLEKTLPN